MATAKRATTKKSPQKSPKLKSTGLLQEIVQRQSNNTARDMRSWREAKREATNIELPKRVRHTELLTDMLYDTHLSSQMELRVEASLAKSFVLRTSSGEVDEEHTALLQESIAFDDLLRTIYETPFWGHSLIELLPSDTDLFALDLLPRGHVVPRLGWLLRDTSDTRGIEYRLDPMYNKRILEFGSTTDLGLLFDCSPSTIYRRYALSAWSEFCEIYGIPPRTLKIDTLDSESFERARRMMQEMGSANWAIIDMTEELTFGAGMSDNGNIFRGLITAAKEDVSLKICGAVIGQDTLNGNRSKEESSIQMLDKKCAADRRRATKTINRTVLPALAEIGILPQGLSFGYDQEEDIEALWQRTQAVLPHYDVDIEWMRNKFGLEITGAKSSFGGAALQAVQLQGGDPDFF